jgi:glycosyltransferase involved in cell wall biosynthesis
MKRLRGSKFAYLWQYSRFLLSSFWFLSRSGLMKKYDVIHVHNMPDFLVFAALVPKLRGARVILDLHDPMPELMMSIYGLEADRWAVRLLRALERWSIRFANLVLTPNIAFKDLFVSRSCPPGKIEIVMNSPQIEIFDPARVPAHQPERDGRRFRVMHHGLIAHRHGVDQLVEAVAKLRPEIPGIQLDIYGSRTAFLDVVLETARKTGCSDIVHYHGTKSQAEIAQAILECDIGVVPNRRSMFTELNFPTRLFEYFAMRRLVIAPSTKGIRDYFSDRQIVYFEPGNVDDLAARLRWVWEHPTECREIVAQGLQVYEHHLWPEEKKHFHALVSRLLSPS